MICRGCGRECQIRWTWYPYCSSRCVQKYGSRLGGQILIDSDPEG